MRTAIAILACALLLAAGNAAGTTLAVEFGDLPSSACGIEWTMSDLTFGLSSWTIGACNTVHTQYGWIVYAACLSVDLAPLQGLGSVTLEYYDYFDGGGTTLYLLDPAQPVATIAGDTARSRVTLALDAAGLGVERAQIYVRNAILYGMVFEFDALPTEAAAWDSIKALYR